MSSKAVETLVESEKIYQMVTERLDLVEKESELTFESELMALILELYSNSESEIEIEKLQKFSLPQILQYLQASHKMYISKTLPEIEQSMAHIQKRVDENSQVLNALVYFFNNYKVQFLDHIRMEERDFFPYLKKLHLAFSGGMSPDDLSALLQSPSIDEFIHDHDAIEDELKAVSEIIHKYSEAESIPLPFKVFLNQVELFEMDLRKHAIIEDYVLVPIALEMERSLRQAKS